MIDTGNWKLSEINENYGTVGKQAARIGPPTLPSGKIRGKICFYAWTIFFITKSVDNHIPSSFLDNGLYWSDK